MGWRLHSRAVPGVELVKQVADRRAATFFGPGAQKRRPSLGALALVLLITSTIRQLLGRWRHRAGFGVEAVGRVVGQRAEKRTYARAGSVVRTAEQYSTTVAAG